MKPDLKEKAIKMRLQGISYKEISDALLVSKSTCSLWCQDLNLPEKALKRLQRIQIEGQKKGQEAGHGRAILRDVKIMEKVRVKVRAVHLSDDLKKLLCSMLYWGEGSKNENRVVFTNSDPLMIKTFLKLFRETYTLDEQRFQAVLHLHAYHNRNEKLQEWSRLTGIDKSKISIYNKLSSGINKKSGYPGCISIRYSDVNVSRDLEAYYKNFITLYGGFV